MIFSKKFDFLRVNRIFLSSNVLRIRHCKVEKHEVLNKRLFSSIKYIATNHKKSPIFARKQWHTSFKKYCTQTNNKPDEYEDKMEGSDSEEILTNEVIKTVGNGDPEIEKKLKTLEFEISFCRDQNFPVPKKIQPHEWWELISLQTVSQRRKYLNFLYINESENAKKADQNIEYKATKEILEEFFPQKERMYGLGSNSILIRVYPKALNAHLNDRLAGAILLHLPIIFDCSYDSYMSKINANYCANQLLSSYVQQRNHEAPLHVKCCNVDFNSTAIKKFKKILSHSFDDSFLWDMHEESYLDLYPKNKFVYLSPHARNELVSFDETKVYIIGAFVDKGSGVKASLAKAKGEGLEMAKFPLDRYLSWKSGGKSLPINTVLQIMLDLRYHRNWKDAFKSIPERKLRLSNRQEIYEAFLRLPQLNKMKI